MSEYPPTVARMEPSGRLRPSSTGYGEIRDRRSRIALRFMRATIVLLAGAGIALAQPAPQAPVPQRPAPQPVAQPQKLTIGFVDIEGDPRYEPIQGPDRLILKTREHPFTGAQVGIDEAQPLTRVLKTDFALERITVKSAAEVAGAVQQALETRDIHLFLVDAPADALKSLAAAVRGRDALIFNVSADDNALRRDLCAAELVHVVPSLAMRMDALVQYLVSRKWRDYLVL